MSKRRGLWIGANVAALAVLAVGLVAVVRRSDDPAPPELAAPGAVAAMAFPTAISVGVPATSVGDVAPVVVGSGSSSPIRSVDLYDGARRIATVAPEPDGRTARIDVPALRAGPHALHAEVTDEQGERSLSPVSVLDVAVAPVLAAPVAVGPGEVPPAEPVEGPSPVDGTDDGATVAVPVAPEEGETVPELAERIGVDDGEVVAPDGPLDPAVPVVVRIPRDAGLDDLAAAEPTVTPPASGGSLGIEAEASGCGATLRAPGAMRPVDWFQAGGAGAGWVAVGSSRASGSLELEALAPGTHVLFARSGDEQSATVAITTPWRCADGLGWTGEARIVDHRLTIDPAALARVPATAQGLTAYLQVDGSTARRIDHLPKSSSIDLRGRLPRLSGDRLELQLDFETDVPQPFASGSLRVPAGTTLASVVGEGDAAALVLRDPQSEVVTTLDRTQRRVALEHDDLTLTFDWSTDRAGVTEALWQVVRLDASGAPLSVASSVEALGAGMSAGQATADGRSTGTFTIDTAAIAGHEAVAQRRAELEAGEPLSPEPAAPPLGTFTPALLPGSLGGLGDGRYAVVDADDVPPDLTGLPAWVPLPGPGETVVVQVLLDPNGPAPGPWTPAWEIELPTPEPPQQGATGIEMGPGSLEVEPGLAPDPAFARCGIVTLPPASARPTDVGRLQFWNAMQALYPGGSGTYCMPPPTPDDGCDAYGVPLPELACDVVDGVEWFLEQTWEAAKAAYATVSQIYGGVIDVAVKLVSEANPLCIAFDEADDDLGGGCEVAFAVAGRAAITVALSSVGLPPSLPSLGELEALASGDLAALGRATMVQLGIPCDAVTPDPAVQEAIAALGDAAGSPEAAAATSDPCLAVLQVMITSAKAQVAAAWTTQLAAATDLPAFTMFEGFAIAPEPRAQPSPTVVRYRAEPTTFDADLTGLSCTVTFERGPSSVWPIRSRTSMPLAEAAPVDGTGPVAVGRSIDFYESATPTDSIAGTTITVDARLSGRCRGGEASATATIPPLPR